MSASQPIEVEKILVVFKLVLLIFTWLFLCCKARDLFELIVEFLLEFPELLWKALKKLILGLVALLACVILLVVLAVIWVTCIL